MSSSSHQPTPPLWRQYAHPRYWLTWIGLGILRILVCLPWKAQLATGRFVGWLIYHMAHRRRHITEVNIKLCFPHLNEAEHQALVYQTMIENALGLIETGISFWGDKEKLRSRVTFEGLDILESAKAEGKGIVLVGAHYTTLDLGGVLFSLFSPVDIMYRPHNNGLFDTVLLNARRRWAEDVIPNNEMRRIIKSLKQGHIFWYPADQDYGPKYSVFAPFFGVNAATITTTSWLARLTQGPVLVLGHHRCRDSFNYILKVERIENFPQADETTNAALVNQAIEKHIRRFPAQYMWVHRRFKTRPPGEPGYYNS